MSYVSFNFYVFALLVLFVYYIFPLRFRWVILLAGSGVFYFKICKDGLWILLITIIVSYLTGLLMDYFGKNLSGFSQKIKKLILLTTVLLLVFIWLLLKSSDLLQEEILSGTFFDWIIPVGISFYTLQIISYLVDVYRGKINVQRNILKYALFVLFFPQIIQGPIPRYQQLAQQLYQGHLFREDIFVKSAQLILWGFFLKLMIADKAAVIVNEIFADWEIYKGCYIWVAGVLYSIELYTDFLACVTISQGVAGLFGIELIDNFKRPYFAVSIKDFWRRWHISLSSWLRDYIYIPLGGNRKGTAAKYMNLLITFAVSGVWHGNGLQFLVWGLMHAVYQIIGELTRTVRNKLFNTISLPEQSNLRKMIQRVCVFVLVTLAWVVFRADTLEIGLHMIKSMFSVYNPWIFFNDQLLNLGLDWKEWCLLLLSIGIMILISLKQEEGYFIRDFVLNRSIYVRWFIYIVAILCIIMFGTYGFGYNAQDFIYGGF